MERKGKVILPRREDRNGISGPETNECIILKVISYITLCNNFFSGSLNDHLLFLKSFCPNWNPLYSIHRSLGIHFTAFNVLLLLWKPFILITNVFSFAGDLTDAKNADDRTSQQFVEEWQTYQQSIEQCKTQTSATFLDTRGNHGWYPQCLAGCV